MFIARGTVAKTKRGRLWTHANQIQKGFNGSSFSAEDLSCFCVCPCIGPRIFLVGWVGLIS